MGGELSWDRANRSRVRILSWLKLGKEKEYERVVWKEAGGFHMFS